MGVRVLICQTASITIAKICFVSVLKTNSQGCDPDNFTQLTFRVTFSSERVPTTPTIPFLIGLNIINQIIKTIHLLKALLP